MLAPFLVYLKLEMPSRVYRQYYCDQSMFRAFNPFKPLFTIVIFIHYKPRIAIAILDL